MNCPECGQQWDPNPEWIEVVEAENIKLKQEVEDWLWAYSLIIGILQGLPGYENAKETSPLGKTFTEGVQLAKRCRAVMEEKQSH